VEEGYRSLLDCTASFKLTLQHEVMTGGHWYKIWHWHVAVGFASRPRDQTS
jgi:hypothetical protein